MSNKIMQNFVVIYKSLDVDNGILVFNIEVCQISLTRNSRFLYLRQFEVKSFCSELINEIVS